MILITHDIALLGQFCDTICVMYAGRLVEQGPKIEVIQHRAHPYTRGLIRSLPGRSRDEEARAKRRRLSQIPGMMPNLIDLPPGCAFAPRCTAKSDACSSQPALVAVSPGHRAACTLLEGRA